MAADRDPPASTVHAELTALVEEMQRLEREGRLDEAARERLQARSDAILRRSDEETEAILAHARDQMRSLEAGSMSWWQWAFVALFIGVVVGAVAHVQEGGFFFVRADAYRAAMPWMFGLLTLAFGTLLLVSERWTNAARATWRNPVLRWGFFFPATAMVISLALVVSPLGWAAMFTRALGDGVHAREGRLLSLHDGSSSSRICRQKGEFLHAGQTANLCLDGRVTGALPKPGDTVLLDGWQTALGFYVGRIARR